MRADAIIFPPELLGELASHQWLQPVPDFVIDNESFADGDLALRDDVLPLARQTLITWGESAYAVPLGAHVYTLGYRKDVLESLGLPPPATFAELQTALEAFADAVPGQRWPEYALAQPLGERWAARTLLAYAAPLCHDRGRFSTLFDLRTMDPSIDSPGFHRAVQLLVTGAGDRGQASLEMDPNDTFAALWQGKCLFAIGWPETQQAPSGDLLERIRIVEFPGAAESYSRSRSTWVKHDEPLRIPLAFPMGRIGAALRNSRSQKPAWNLIVRLSGRQWGLSVCAASDATGPLRASQLDPWLRRLPPALGYREAVRATLGRRRGLPLLRIPGAGRYLGALDEAIRAAAQGALEGPAAIEQTRRRWGQITTELGLESQIQAYYHNLGLEP
jgi:hypothetical protein